MLVSEVIGSLENIAPRSSALSWDNVGLLSGSKDSEVKKIYVALEATSECIENAINADADMLITHHPLIFREMKSVVYQDFIGKRIIRLIENHIAYFAMHTNYDIHRMGTLVAERLGFSQSIVLEEVPGLFDAEGNPLGLGRLGSIEKPMTLREYASFVKDALQINSVRIWGDPDTEIRVVGLLPGSGKSDIDLAKKKGADVYITGDVDHHSGLDAVEKGLTLIDAGHYGMEYLFTEDVAKYLREQFPDAEIITAEKQEPFITI